MKKTISYSNAGVDIDEGARLVSLIRPYVKNTAIKGVIGSIGGFGALFDARFKGLKDPVLVSSTDGVGTKLKVAFMAKAHSTVGIDLVAMSVNDILCNGARPLFFLDYFATGSLDAKEASEVVKGIAKGCRIAGCALVGGETAEMPGFYGKGEYDLAGFAIGVVERKRLITGSAIRRGDKIIGLASSGLHSNGYSLARKLLFDDLGLNVKSRPIGFKRTMGKTLLEPTRIYVKPVLKVTSEFSVNGVAHITGGGLIENIPRIIPKGLKAVIEPGSWPMPKIFGFIKANGPISDHEMLRTFNCGIGMVIVVRSSVASAARDRLNSLGEKAHIIGEIRGSSSKAPVTEFSGPLGWK